MSGRKCYICEKPLDDEEAFVIKLDDESFDLCEQHYQTSQKMFAHIDKRKKELEGKICCKNYGKGCEYDSTWFCKNPDCITPVITSTLEGAFKMNGIPTYSRPTASEDIYRCPMCGDEFVMNYKAPYCDHCGAEFETMENPRGDWRD